MAAVRDDDRWLRTDGRIMVSRVIPVLRLFYVILIWVKPVFSIQGKRHYFLNLVFENLLFWFNHLTYWTKKMEIELTDDKKNWTYLSSKR